MYPWHECSIINIHLYNENAQACFHFFLSGHTEYKNPKTSSENGQPETSICVIFGLSNQKKVKSYKIILGTYVPDASSGMTGRSLFIKFEVLFHQSLVSNEDSDDQCIVF